MSLKYFGVFIIFLIFIAFFKQAYAAPICGGTFRCYAVQTDCGWTMSSLSCETYQAGQTDPFLGICVCNSSCTSNIDGPWQCTGGSTCPDSSPTSYLCSEMCNKPPNWYGCFVQQDACTGFNTGCSANRVCCGGSPNYCSNNCEDCAGNYICPTATPTPQPPGPPMGNTSTPACGTGTQANVTYTWTAGTNAQQHYICSGAGSSYDPRAPENSINCALVSSSPHTIVGYTQGNIINWDIKACNGNTCVFSANGYYNVTLPSNCGAAAPTATPPPGSTATPTPPVGSTPTSTPVPTATPASTGCPSVGRTCTNFADCCGGTANPQQETCVSNRCQAVPTPTPVSGGGGGGSCTPPPSCGVVSICSGNGVQAYNQCSCTYGPIDPCPFGCFDGYCLGGSVSGYTYRDANGNGVQDYASTSERWSGISSIEPGIGSIGLALTGPQNKTDASRASGSFIGYYSFSVDLVGTYTVRVNTPNSYINTSNQSVSVDLVSGSNSRTVGFGLLESSSTPIPTPTPTSGAVPTPTPTSSVPASCIGGLNTNSAIVPPGSTIKLTVAQCSGVNPIGSTPTPTPTPIGGSTPTPVQPTPTPCPWWFFCSTPTATPTLTPTPTPFGATPVPTYTPFKWNPNTSNNTPPPTQSGQVDNPSTGKPTSSSIDWTAPLCPPAGSSLFQPGVTIEGPSGSVFYSTGLTVPGTVSLTGNVIVVGSVPATCTTSSGSAYNNNGSGALLTMLNTTTGTAKSTITNTTTGAGVISCLNPGDYKLSVGLPSGYNLVKFDVSPATESQSGPTELQFNTSTNNQVANLCVTQAQAWFQTDRGDVRFSSLTNLVPAGKYGSIGENTSTPGSSNYPGIFYSSKSNSNFGTNSTGVSSKGWKVDREFDFNATTENINGGLSYSFYKSKARQDGVTITNLPNPIFSQNDLTNLSNDYNTKNAAVFESVGDLLITDTSGLPQPGYSHVSGKRVVILVNGDVTIDDNTIEVPSNGGLFIIAAKGKIRFASKVGVSDPSTGYSTSQTPRIDGYYSAEGDIILDGSKCSGNIADKRLNIGGALIAHSLKPFSTSGSGSIVNNRSLCGGGNGSNPVLFVASRPDFLTQLTDFYKTSYTKWKEVNP